MLFSHLQMPSKRPSPFTILGVSPAYNGFGFAVLEPAGRLISWGIARLYSKKTDEFRQRLDALFEKYCVRTLCVEDVSISRRRQKARDMIAVALELGRKQKREVVELQMAVVSSAFGVEATQSRHDMAVRIAEALPELETVLPESRKPWQSEDQRMRIFEAAALATAAINGSPIATD